MFFKTAVFLTVFMWFGSMCNVHAQQPVNVEDVERYIVRAQSAYERGDFNKALAEYKEAQKLVPQYPEVYKAIGGVYEKLGGTANLTEAIASYNQYLKLAPQADDFNAVQKRVWELEEFSEETAKQDVILDDLSGEWASIDNVQILETDTKTGNITWITDCILKIEEVGKTGKFRITILQEGSRLYSESIIDKTVDITFDQDNFFSFTFADVRVHTPNQGGYEWLRLGGRVVGELAGASDIVQDMVQTSITSAQLNDLPNSTQTAYIFKLKYIEGKLKGMINIVGKFTDQSKQQTTKNELREITFTKKSSEKFGEEFQAAIENMPDVISINRKGFFFNKFGEKIPGKEVYNRLNLVNPDFGKRYKIFNRNNTGAMIVAFTGLGIELSSFAFAFNENTKETGDLLLAGGIVVALTGCIWWLSNASKLEPLIDDYNKQISSKPKHNAELHLGITPSGGFGLALNF
jgi:tetratricopeptide (TPR) repeat protein